MSCLDAEEIARAALADDAVLLDPHLASCLDCRRRLAEDRSARDAIRRLPLPRLSPSHRRELAAEILAAAQLLPPRRRHRSAIAAATAIALAAAAAVTLVARWPHTTTATSAAPSPLASERVDIRAHSIAFVEPPPGPTTRHVMTLADGNLVVDTRVTPDVDVKVGDSVIRVDDSAVRIQARRGKVISVQVIVGAAEIRTGAQRVRIERDALWVAQPEPTASTDAPAVPTAPQQAMTEFRAAWLALRAGNNREAIDLFDRVTDPVAREEALYWAAIAADRLGDAELSRARHAKLHEEFPQSTLGQR